MAAYKRTIVMFAVPAVIACGAIALRKDRTTATAAGQTSGIRIAQYGKTGYDYQGLCRSQSAEDPNLAGTPMAGSGGRELVIKMLLSIVVVGMLGAAAIYASRKFGFKLAGLTGSRIRVIETVHIGPRKSLHLLQVGARTILIGSSGESIAMLTDLTDGVFEEPEQTKGQTEGST